MELDLTGAEIALRLGLTVAASAVIGFNRGEHGHPAGLRTTILVGVAAAAAMIQANLLLGLSGRKPDSFVMLDLMRLPLGILSGMGFIGAGAILRRGQLVLGVTTAATLWFVTVMGLAFGGGQLALGLAMLAIGAAVLWLLKWVEDSLGRESRARLTLTFGAVGNSELADEEIRDAIRAAGFKIIAWGETLLPLDERRQVRCVLRAPRKSSAVAQLPAAIVSLAKQPGVTRLDWRP